MNQKRFDIIVFHAPENKDYIKRVIGLPGDTVEYKDDTLYMNGKPYEEPYLDEYKKEVIDGPLTDPFTLEEKIGQETVPKVTLFVMGDNRRFSKDSRHIGTVPMEEVLGKTSIVYWPIEDFIIRIAIIEGGFLDNSMVSRTYGKSKETGNRKAKVS